MPFILIEAGAVAARCVAMRPGTPGAATGTGDPSPKPEPVSGEDVERLLTPAEVAQLFRVNPKTVTRWATTGHLGSIRTPGGHRRFRETEVSALFAALSEVAPNRGGNQTDEQDPPA